MMSTAADRTCQVPAEQINKLSVKNPCCVYIAFSAELYHTG